MQIGKNISPGGIKIFLYLVEKQCQLYLYVVDFIQTGVKFLERYGWLILFALVFLVFLWSKLKPHLVALQKKWEQQNEIANFGKIL